MSAEKQSGDCKIYNSHILHLITYEEDRLNYFTDLMEKAQKSFDRLNKRFEKSPHLFVGTDLLGDAGRELQFHKDVVEILKQGCRKQNEGEWKGNGYLKNCSECGNVVNFNNVSIWLYNFCPNCGAKMKDGAE